MIPQIILISIYAIGLGIHIARHGTPMTSKYNFFLKITFIAIHGYILYRGGFWDSLIK